VGEAADLVRKAIECLNERDVDGWVELCSPRIRFQDVPEIPGSRLYEGKDGVRQWAEGVLDLADDLTFALWEIEERDDTVIADTGADMTGASSGIELGWRFWTVWRIREGLIAYHHGYSDKAEARADFEGPG
jgi:ketosteroid isomerase-like protein